jgi:CRP-like cAMP-binding protein
MFTTSNAFSMCFSQEADFSARNVHHRSTDNFEEMVAKTSLLLRKNKGSAVEPGLQFLAEIPTASTSTISPVTQRNRFISARLARAYAHHRLQRYAEAVDDYTECLKNAPAHPVVYYNRACSLYGLGRLEEAARDLTKAIKLDNKSLLFVESRARVLKELGQFQEAIRDYSWLASLRRAIATGRNVPLVSDEDDEVELSSDAGRSRANSLALSLELDAAATVSGLQSLQGSPSATSQEPRQSDRGGRQATKDWLVSFLTRGRLARSSSDIQGALQRVGSWSVFRGMDNAMVEKCLSEATHRSFSAEQTIVKQGVPNKSFFVVLDTTAPLVRTVGATGAAKYRELKTLYQGDCVGIEPPGTTSTDGRFLTFRSAVPVRGGHIERLVGDATALSPLTNPILPRMKSFRSLVGLAMTPDSTGTTSSSSKAGFVTPEPATLSCLGDVSCLVLNVSAYYSILRAHEQAQHASRLEFLRQCRGFESLPEDTLSSLAAASGAKIYDPGTDVLRTGDVVKQLWLIKRGVCQVRKAITLAPASVGRTRESRNTRRHHGAVSASDPLTSRSVDGSWVLDNGWMLTNPRLVTGAQELANAKKVVTEDVTVAVLASGQLFGELSVLQPGQPSPVTVRTQTMVETLVLQAEDLSELSVQYHSGTMNALQESLLFHNPPQQKIAQLHHEHERWSREKVGVLDELFPSKSVSALQTLATPSRAKTAAASRRTRVGPSSVRKPIDRGGGEWQQ